MITLLVCVSPLLFLLEGLWSHIAVCLSPSLFEAYEIALLSVCDPYCS
jgi:hypothetical protein